MDKLAELIAGAAERLGIEATRIWPQVVMMTLTRALCDLVTEVVCLAVGGWLLVRVVAWTRAHAHDRDDGPVAILGGALGAGALAVLILVAFLSLPGTISTVAYPEAATVLRLVGK